MDSSPLPTPLPPPDPTKVLRHWEDYVSGKRRTDGAATGVLDHWDRVAHRVDPKLDIAPQVLNTDAQAEVREQHAMLIDVVRPIIERAYIPLEHVDSLIVLADADSTSLDYSSRPSTVRKAAPHNFIPGAVWLEQNCGNNAIGTALLEDRLVTFNGPEHFCRGWHAWNCTASPIHDPYTNRPVGVLDFTIRANVTTDHAASVVHSLQRVVEQELWRRLVFGNNPLYLALERDEMPWVAFLPDGTTTKVNKLAWQLLDLKAGQNLTDRLHLPPGSRLDNFHKVSFPFKDGLGMEWNTTIFPHRMNGRILGGIATFQRVERRGTTKMRRPAEVVRPVRFAGDSAKLRRAVTLAEKAANYPAPCLITGETGTGKDLLAQHIHHCGKDRTGDYVAVNCGGVSKEMIASELFGYEKGAFTGANTTGRKGKIELADRGTLFLDEIGELPLDLQAYLLRFLEDGIVHPLGGEQGRRVDVRIVAATNRDLHELVRDGRFRSDLLYRLDVIHITTEPLRALKSDIPSLIGHFLALRDQAQVAVEEAVIEVLQRYDWPGNIRELRNVVDRMLFNLEPGETTITLAHVPERLIAETGRTEVTRLLADHAARYKTLKKDKVARRELVLTLIDQLGGNATKAAEVLGVSRMTVHRIVNEG